MKILPKPIPDIAAEEIFEVCVGSFTDEKKRTKLLSCKGLVKSDSDSYEKTTPSSIQKFTPSVLPEEVSSAEMSKVYTDKFANQAGPGRVYYNKIMAQTNQGTCPICGVRIACTLDHYLPKSKVPTLAVTPSNLIPTCRDCNFDKHADMEFDPNKTPVHIYFDELPNVPWLFVNIGSLMEVTYYISCPNTWDAGLRNRVEQHLDFYNLHQLYSSHAAQEIADAKMLWQTLLTTGGQSALHSIICSARKSAECNDMNSWKAALYRNRQS